MEDVLNDLGNNKYMRVMVAEGKDKDNFDQKKKGALVENSSIGAG
jgi:hypothetical protein